MAGMVVLNNIVNIGLAQSFSVAMAATVMADSIGLLMENAVSNEENASVIQSASVTQCCGLILAEGGAKAAKPA